MTTPRYWDPITLAWVSMLGPQGAQGSLGTQGAQGTQGSPGTQTIATFPYTALTGTATEVLNNNVNGNAAGYYRFGGYLYIASSTGTVSLALNVQVTDDSATRRTLYCAMAISTGVVGLANYAWAQTNAGGALLPITVHQATAGSANRVAVFASVTNATVYMAGVLEQLTTV